MVASAAQALWDMAFSNPLFAKAALYTAPGGGAATECTVLVGRGDVEIGGFNARPTVKGGVLEVRKSEVNLPARDGSFVILDENLQPIETLTVTGDVRSDDDERLVWTMTVR